MTSATLPKPPTRSGLLPEARHLVLPDGIMSSGFPATEATSREIGVFYDPWQQDMNRCILAKTASGEYAADTVVMSICRQAGKTFDVGGLVFSDSIINPGTTTVWTAHRFPVSRESFLELRALASTPKMFPHVDPDEITSAAGNECIPFRNGSRIMFKARERGAIRGFTKVRRIVLDEAQILSESAMADMAPTMNHAVNPQIILMGTPPKPTDPAEVFVQMRAEALDGTSSGLLYVEFSADADADIDDRDAWRTANPSFPRRTSEKAIQRLRKLLTVDDFRREALGIWDDRAGRSSLFDPAAWADLAISADVVELEGRPAPVALAVATSQDREWTHVGLVGMRADGVTRHLVVARSMRGTEAAKAAVEELIEKWSPVGVAVNPSSPAGSLIPELRTIPKVRSKRCQLWEVSPRQEAQAVGMFLDGFAGRTDEGDGEPSLSHQSQTVLGIAVEHAELRNAGQAQTFDHRVEGADVAPLQAVTLAMFALESLKSKRAPVRASFQ